ncbi:MAG: transcriptional repressor LexA [Chloroflexota bacterium]
MMMARKHKGLSERQKKLLEVLERFLSQHGYPPSIREMGRQTGISSTSLINYYLDQLEEMNYIERDRKVSRGIRLTIPATDIVANAAQQVEKAIDELLRIPIVGRIVAGEPIYVPPSGFSNYDPESMVEVATSLLPKGGKAGNLFALEVQGDSMIDAMVNDGDIVIMEPAQKVDNGEMVAIWRRDKDETTLKYFFLENGKVRLQPANPKMDPIFIDDPEQVEIQGKVIMVIRKMETLSI